MIERDVVVVSSKGLHARAAAKVVQLAQRFPCSLELVGPLGAADAKSILGLLMLEAVPGTRLRLRAEGPGAEEAAQALVRLFAEGFGGEAAPPGGL